MDVYLIRILPCLSFGPISFSQIIDVVGNGIRFRPRIQFSSWFVLVDKVNVCYEIKTVVIYK